jgi:hypothetical protein
VDVVVLRIHGTSSCGKELFSSVDNKRATIHKDSNQQYATCSPQSLAAQGSHMLRSCRENPGSSGADPAVLQRESCPGSFGADPAWRCGSRRRGYHGPGRTVVRNETEGLGASQAHLF